MKNAKHRTASAILFIASAVLLTAASQEKTFVTFERFLERTRAAKFKDYAGKKGTRVRGAAEFETMRRHILSLYDGVRVHNSFVLGNDLIDCVDVNTQPGLRQGATRLKVEEPPPPQIAKEERATSTTPQSKPVEPMLKPGRKDAHGNVQFCASGTIPMRRVTLEDLVRYETLADFLNKYGRAGEKGLPQRQ